MEDDTFDIMINRVRNMLAYEMPEDEAARTLVEEDGLKPFEAYLLIKAARIADK